jgi:hypothetical protein
MFEDQDEWPADKLGTRNIGIARQLDAKSVNNELIGFGVGIK